jgi:hypothetical protein
LLERAGGGARAYALLHGGRTGVRSIHSIPQGMTINMKKSSVWLSAMAAGAALCAGQPALADDTVSAVYGTEYLETIYATVMPDGSIVLSHEAPKAEAPAETSETAEPAAEAEESAEESTTEKYPEI